MTIRFNDLPSELVVPGSYVEINTNVAATGLPNTEDVVCLLGQKTADGTATAETLQTIRSADEAGELFGVGSMLHRMALAALTANPYMASLKAVALADIGGGTAASGTLTVSVTTVEAGTLKIRIGADWLGVAVAEGDTDEDIAAAIEAAIDDEPSLPVTASVSAEVVTLTCRHKGTLGNDIDLDWEYSTSGVSVAIVAMASGATDPDLQDALDVILQSNVTVLVSAYADATNLGDLSDHLDSRSDGVNQRGAIGVAALDTTVSTSVSRAAAVNSGRISLAVCEGSPSWAPEIAAAYAAAIAGEPDLALPLNGVVLSGIAPPEEADRFIQSEQDTLIKGGVTPLGVSADEEVRIIRSVSTKTTDSNGGTYKHLRDIQVIRVLDYARRVVKAEVDSRFARVKLAAVAHTATATDPAKIRAVIINTLKALEKVDYLQNVDDNLDGVVVEINGSDPTRVDAVIPGDVVRGLHVKAFRIDLL